MKVGLLLCPRWRVEREYISISKVHNVLKGALVEALINHHWRELGVEIDWAVGSNSRANSSGVRPDRTRSTICRRNSGG
jgi:hypothetical protein